jgi:LmbE family N-acetylglucosaminyl deacetylase
MKVLVIAAHPDDETLGLGGTIAKYSEQKDEVWVLILAEGSEGRTPRHRHIELRKKCASQACQVLGVSRVIFCDMQDQKLDVLPLLDVIKPIEDCVRKFKPDVVYTHFKEDVNQDHRIAFQATMVATRPFGDNTVRKLLCYETPSSTEWAAPFTDSLFAPNVFVDISATLDKKIQAMQMYANTYISEVRPYPHPRSYEAIEIYAKRYGIIVGVRAAEAFMLVRELI